MGAPPAFEMSMLIPALFGLILLLFAHKLVAFLMGGLAWQRRNIPDRSVPLQERIVSSRIFLWFLRFVGAMMLLGAALSAFGLGGGETR